ncbi:MAG: hypothetical protein KJ585_04860 [Alphaproteobacteria bacterium]|nr:hypothetical protein [Alphaproteobacteria bacterium]
MARNTPFPARLARHRAARERAGRAAISGSERPLDAQHPLVQALGMDRAAAILSPQPTPLQALWAERRAIVARRIAEGVAVKDIARELGVTPCRIHQLRKAIGL